jgi:peptidoglycan/xylan/chitin deacetylase (PgdA/CDA1 family)
MSQYYRAVPILRRYNIPASFFITTAYKGKLFMQPKELIQLSQWGFDIGSHSKTHRRLTHLNREEIMDEVAASRESLQNILGKKVDKLSIPFGAYNKQILEILYACGVASVFTTDAMFNVDTIGAKLLHRYNIKQNTSSAEIEKIIQENWKIGLRYRIKGNALKFLNKRRLSFLMQNRDEKIHSVWISEEVNNV